MARRCDRRVWKARAVAQPIPQAQAPAQTADDQGKLTFTFAPAAFDEVWTGTLQVPDAPGGAKWTAYMAGYASASGIGANVFGPVQLSPGAQLTVKGTSLQPGTQYQCVLQGEVSDPDDATPVSLPAVATIVQPPNSHFIGTREVNPSVSETIEIPVDSSWRGIWVMTLSGFGDAPNPASLTGLESGIAYSPSNPPYVVSPATFQRFALVAGVDSTVVLNIENFGAGDDRLWWGADLDTVDVTVTGKGGGALVFYAALTGAGETVANGRLTFGGPMNVAPGELLDQTRILSREVTINAPGATPTYDTDNLDVLELTGVNTPITSMTTNATGTPNAPDLLEVDFIDNGTPQGITWGALFRATTVALPTATKGNASEKLYSLFRWNTESGLWDCVAVA